MGPVRRGPEPCPDGRPRPLRHDLLLQGPARVTELTVLFAPDSFKGSLSSVEVARALAAGWTQARPDDVVEHAPLGDGGEGTIHAVAFGGGWDWVRSVATMPNGTQGEARWLRSDDGARAYIELAEASGLSKADHRRLDPIGATTRGTGELIVEAV